MECTKYVHQGSGLTLVMVFGKGQLVWLQREDLGGIMMGDVFRGEVVNPKIYARAVSSVPNRAFSWTDVHRMLLTGIANCKDVLNRYRYTSMDGQIELITPTPVSIHELEVFSTLRTDLIGESISLAELASLKEKVAVRINRSSNRM
jgi:hypothetical protein